MATGAFSGNGVTGSNNIAVGTGSGNGITASNTIAVGTSALASADDGIAIGTNAYSGGASVAIGVQSYAEGPNDTAVGPYAVVNASYGTAVGSGAYVASGARYGTAVGAQTAVYQPGGVAIGVDSTGQGAVSSLSNQFVLGTDRHTYTAPGITSNLSRARQSGPLELVTSDAVGNLATDGGALIASIDRNSADISKNKSGVALAISMENPDLVGGENFGIAAHYGNFQGASAASVSVMGVLQRGVFQMGDRVAVSGAFGAGFQTGTGSNVYGGRAGIQYTW